MTIYEITRILGYMADLGSGTALLESTDPEVVNWFLTEVKKLAPRCKIEVCKFPSGEPCFVRVEKLPVPGTVAIWLIKQLGLKGWEPFSADSKFVAFRLKRD